MYKCINELEHMSFNDASVEDVEIIPGENDAISELVFHISGVIIKADNSCNANYTDSYAGDMELRFKNLEIEALLQEGHKLYDANDVLIEEVPDKPIACEDYKSVIKSFKGCPVFYGGSAKTEAVDTEKLCYQFIIDKEEESYVISILYDEAIARWEKFLNKVYRI